MKIADITNYIESIAPLAFQESYDNAGLIVGNKHTEVSEVLISLDITEEVVEEAVKLGANLIVCHHPIVFSGLKQFNGKNYVERCVISAIKNDIAIYAAHTNLDSLLYNGVNSKIAEKLGLTNCKILKPSKGLLNKLVVFVPKKQADAVREAMFKAGAGKIGNYDSCSYNNEGTGTFRGNDSTNPFVGKPNELHNEDEIRIETVVPKHLTNAVVVAMKNAHPYEEVAYDIYSIENTWDQMGAGMVGELEKPIEELDFLHAIKNIFQTGSVRYTKLLNKKISKVAVCGGSGSFLLNDAIRAGADIFISGDFKYHQFFDAENKIVIADIGHFESEQFTKALFYELLTRKFSTFAIHLSNVNTNPIKYL